VDPLRRRRRGDRYQRWQRQAPMELWQMDIVDGGKLADGSPDEDRDRVDDHSRFCVIAAVVPRPTGRAVCLALADALRRFGIPQEILTDNGRQFTARFGTGGETLFDRICRENGHHPSADLPSSPTTTGKVERFHQTLRRNCSTDGVPFASLADAQAAVDGFRHAVQRYASAPVLRHGRPGRSVPICACRCDRLRLPPNLAEHAIAIPETVVQQPIFTAVGSVVGARRPGH
jgi:transposase InsO family protein